MPPVPKLDRSTAAALQRFVGRTVAAASEALAWPPRVEHDPEWPLLCALGPPDETGTVAWAPTRREAPPDFGPVERVAGPLHQDVKDFFGTFWSCTLAGLHRDEPVYLASFENEQRERQTLRSWTQLGTGGPILVAHFGDDRWIGVNVKTARVSLEEPGRPPSFVAESLADWLDALRPLASW